MGLLSELVSEFVSKLRRWVSGAKTPEELAAEYDRLVAELSSLAKRIKKLQQLAQRDIVSRNFQRAARAGREAKVATALILRARAVAVELRKVCVKLGKPIPDIVNTLISEFRQEGRLDKLRGGLGRAVR